MARRGQIVAYEQVGGLSRDLCVQLHNQACTGKPFGPGARFGQIGQHRFDLRVQLAQDVQIVRMLVDRHQPGVALLLHLHDEVLPHQAGCAGDDDLVVLVCHGPARLLME